MIERLALVDQADETGPGTSGSDLPPPGHPDRVLGAILVLAVLLLFWSLDGRSLWQDEAETALLAKSILKHGVPIAQDGANVVSQEASKEFVAGSRLPYFLWRWSPWAQFYIAAGSFALLGPTTLAARLPFAVLGLVAVYLTYVLARRLSGSLAVARLSAFYLTTSVPFLLHVRQARWCAPAYCSFAELLLSLEGLVAGRKHSWAGFVASGVLLFYTNYFVAIGLLTSTLAAALFLNERRPLLRKLASAYLTIALLVLPGVFLFQVLEKSKGLALSSLLSHLTYYSGAYFTFLLPLPVLALLLWLLVAERPAFGPTAAARRSVLGLLAISVLYIGYLALGPWVEFRYLTMLLPIAAILLAVATDLVRRTNAALGVALLSVLVLTNIAHRAPLGYIGMTGTQSADRFPSVGPISFPLLGLMYELTHHFDAPESILAGYLNQHANKTDVVIATYDDLPLQFYTGLRVAGGLEGRKLPDDPDWLIRRRWIVSGEPGKDNDVDIQIGRLIMTNRYELIKLNHKDHMLGTNPDPKHHFFVAPESGPRLIMLKKKR
jgi:4-amino-4-deoxy-L-arabinose transferase-like glycosyltransferase